MEYIFAEYSMYFFILGKAVIYFTFLGISKSLHLFFIPKFFIAGLIAKHIPPLPREGSATTRLVLNGSNPLSAHSTEA